MKFDKPIVLLKDIPEIMSSYDLGPVTQAKYLGGVPNATYRVITTRAELAVRICNHGYTSEEHLRSEILLLLHLETVDFKESPVPVKGANQEYIQNWRGYRVFAMRLINGFPGDRVALTRELCFDVGRAVAQMQKALRSYRKVIPNGETYAERGLRLLNLLPETSKTMGWNINVEIITNQWQIASMKIAKQKGKLSHSVIHTDVWPPNIICNYNKVTGVVDFDDWAYGPTFIDLVAPLVEFPMFNRLDFDENLAYTLLKGFFEHGGELTKRERELLPIGMEMACASWLACNALHQMQFEESEIYLQKLEILRDADKRNSLVKKIEQCIDEAKTQHDDHANKK